MAIPVYIKGLDEPLIFPDGMSSDQIKQAVDKFTKSEAYLRASQPQEYAPETPEFQKGYGPTSAMSGPSRVRAGYGKSIYDLGRGAGQMVGAVSREDVQQSRARDAPLMATPGGRAGSVAGLIANTLPAALIPGANTVAGSAAIGAGVGLLQPSTSTRETLANVGLGGAGGAGGLLAGRGLAAGYQGGKAIIEPFTTGGQQRVAQRTMRAFAGGRDRARQAAGNIDDYYARQTIMGDAVPGVQPTAAELAQSPGVAQLERTLRNNPEYNPAITEQIQGNKDALVSSLDEIAGTPFQMEGAIAKRSARAEPHYSAARQAQVSADPELANLLQRPSMTKAWERAVNLAAERGQAIQPGKIDGNTLHYLKMAMDDLSDNPMATGITGNEAQAIGATRNALVQWLGKNIPEYDLGRKTYAELSKPINQMEIGTALRNKLQPALGDMGATSRTRASMYADALRGGDAFSAKTLGRSSSDMSEIMSPQQMTRLRAIGEALGRRSSAEELGRGVGSPTAQNMVGQNVLRQLLGPLGLPESTIQRAAQSTLIQSTLGRGMKFVGAVGEERVMEALAKAAMDPKLASEWLKAGIDPQQIGLLIRNQHYLAPLGASGANVAGQK